ncbi:MAG: glycosyltransferase [Fusobacterium sp.]|nr:glycosyltransferase [Fusobacterium sp.]
MYKISVVIPVYNVEKYLSRCLESVVNQTFKDLEIICIDDGSSDKSLEILRSYAEKDSRFVIVVQKNSGPSVARNKGIDIAKGKYISFIDADDWIDLNFYEKLYSAAVGRNADIAAAGIIRLNNYKKKFYINYTCEELSNDPNRKFELCDVPDRNYVWNKIYKLEKIRQKNLRFKAGVFYEDIIFTPEVIYNLEKLVTVAQTFYYYWKTQNSIVTQKSEKYKKDLEAAMLEAEIFMKEHNIFVEHHTTKLIRYKFLGLSVFKIRIRGKKKEFILFNILKFRPLTN